MEKEEREFRDVNKDCFIPEGFHIIHGEYANLPEYLRRWCIYKEKKRGGVMFKNKLVEVK